MTQTEWIRAELFLRPLTPVDALKGCGCFRLAARIQELRASGLHITSEVHRLPNGKTVARYHLQPTQENPS